MMKKLHIILYILFLILSISLVSATIYTDDADLQLYIDCDDTFNDSSQHNDLATSYSGSYIDNTVKEGIFGRACDIDGDVTGIMPHKSYYDNETYCVVFWVRWDDADDDSSYFPIKYDSGTEDNWGMNYGNPIYFNIENSVEYIESFGFSPSDEVWEFITSCYDGNGYHTYLNGTLKKYDTTAVNGLASNPADWDFGWGSDFASRYWGGSFDEFILITRNLTIAEISWLYNNKIEVVVVDTTEPSFSTNKTNATASTPRINEILQINITVTDDIDIDTIKLSTNQSGALINVSSQTFTGGSDTTITAIFNLSITMNRGLMQWQIWANDSTNNANISQLFTVIIQNTVPNVPTITSPYNDEINNIINIEFNTTDADADSITYNIYINGTLNITTAVNITNWAGSDGYYNLTITANDSIDVSANSTVIHFTLDATKPSVNIIYPDNINSSVATIDLNATATDSIASSLTFYWIINGTLNSTTTDSNSTFTGSTGYYNLTLFVSDGLQNGTDTVFFWIDTTMPQITMYYPASDNSTKTLNLGLITLNSTFTDNRDLYVYNISIYKIVDDTLMFNDSSFISGFSYDYDSLLNTESWENTTYREEIRICDSHTSLEITDANIIKRTDELIYQFGNTIINIKSMNGNEFSTNTKKEFSRYTFSFGYSKKTTEKIFRITSNRNIDYLPYSDYKGHLIINDELWLDFENNFDADVLVRKENDTYYVHVMSDDNYIIFNSIGYLNCITKHYSFELRTHPLIYDIGLLAGDWFNISILNTSTTAGVLLFFFLFIIFVSLVVFTEYIKIPAFALLTGIYGVFLGFLLYAVISAILGFIIIILSIFYIISLIRFT